MTSPTPSRQGRSSVVPTSDGRPSTPSAPYPLPGPLDYEEEDRIRAALFFQLNAAARRARVECYGCGHDKHAASGCTAAPKFTRKEKCGCPMDTLR